MFDGAPDGLSVDRPANPHSTAEKTGIPGSHYTVDLAVQNVKMLTGERSLPRTTPIGPHRSRTMRAFFLIISIMNIAGIVLH